jgi:hypothetical protein
VIGEDGAFEFRFVFYAPAQVVAMSVLLPMVWQIRCA